MESVYRWGRHMNYLFEGCGYQLLLFVESKRSSFSKLMGLFAFLLQKNLETLVTHSSKLVLFIFEREFIGGARLAHNLWKNKAQVSLFFCPSISPSFWTVSMLYNWCPTFPHARQWCLLHVWVNLEVQTIHMEARLSGIHIGALDPKGAPSPTSVPSSWIWVVQKKWRHTGVSVAAHTMLNIAYILQQLEMYFFKWSYHIFRLARGKAARLLGVFTDRCGNRFKPFVLLLGRATERENRAYVKKQKQNRFKQKKRRRKKKEHTLMK